MYDLSSRKLFWRPSLFIGPELAIGWAVRLSRSRIDRDFMLSVGPGPKSLETRPGAGQTGLSQLKRRSGSDQSDFRTGKQETSAISSLKARSGCFIVESNC